MKLKGEMVIELTDTNTGAVETVQETNMITEAVNNILGLNPMGIYLKASGEYDNSVLWNGTLLPICPNMIGGILLFPAVLEEKADHIYEQGKNLPVAYASNNVNSGSNVARGSLNQTESKKLDNGYKFVWEFTPSQGNGNIAAVALTSALGGQNAFGSAAPVVREVEIIRILVWRCVSLPVSGTPVDLVLPAPIWRRQRHLQCGRMKQRWNCLPCFVRSFVWIRWQMVW